MLKFLKAIQPAGSATITSQSILVMIPLRKGDAFVKAWLSENCRMTCVEGKGQLALSECTKFIGDQDIPTGGQQQLERRAGLHFSGLWGGINRFYFDST